ncbi:sensor histidine kinase KdpD [Kitasatospora aureofaciens]|uniref:sensor histidine kinase n=1 Tax=Kitasatospora aureofaciens TaxID=1894 RepID=UPI001C447B86|nr:ATP-binding protein [Kitasatospora aureofaciens]MBV6696835.1 ATP-binding protein [Kitasatospora aureofaciens]
MLRAGSSPGRRPSAPVLGWLLPSAVLVSAMVATATVVAAGARADVLWCGLAGTVAVAAVAVEAGRRGRALTVQREQHAQREEELHRRLVRQDASTTALAKKDLPAAVARLRHTGSVDNALRAHESRDPMLSPEYRAARDDVLYQVLRTIDNEEAMREASQRAFVNIARRVQAIIHRQAQDLREMEDRHGNDPAVFDDLLRLDHGNALTGRLADSIAVLGGARPGRQWSRPVALYSVLRGGMSRILEYQRVDLHPVSEVAVIGPAVEPLIHAVAELLDNATRYSPPHTHVHLSASEVQTGMAIEIEDGGLGLSEEGRLRAERTLKLAQGEFDLNDLGETPRLGLAVVGRLCRAYGFQISLRPSAYGGVRAVLIVPQELITTAPATGRAHGIGSFSGPRPLPANPPRPKAGSRPWGATSAHASVAGPSFGTSPWAGTGPARSGPIRPNATRPGPMNDDVPVVTERTANGLPQRRRHRPPLGRAGVPGPGRAPQPAPPPAQQPDRHPDRHPAAQAKEAKEPVQPGIWLEAFLEGVNGQPPSTGSAGQTNEETAGKGEQ